jgi:phospholipid transport system substrate-binding protein
MAMSATHRWFSRGLAATVATITLFFAASVAAPAGADANSEAYIQKVASEVTDILNNKTTSKSAKEAALTSMIDSRLDLDRIAKFTLGKYARVATDAEMAQYIPLLKQYVINFYVDNLVNYHDVSLKVKGSVDLGGEKGSVVKSAIASGADAPVDANWWVVTGKDGNLRVFDAQLQGLWVAQNLRSTLAAVMDNGGGKVSVGIEELRKKVNAAPPG